MTLILRKLHLVHWYHILTEDGRTNQLSVTALGSCERCNRIEANRLMHGTHTQAPYVSNTLFNVVRVYCFLSKVEGSHVIFLQNDFSFWRDRPATGLHLWTPLGPNTLHRAWPTLEVHHSIQYPALHARRTDTKNSTASGTHRHSPGTFLPIVHQSNNQ